MLDNHIHHGNALKIDVRRVSWKRVLDMNDSGNLIIDGNPISADGESLGTASLEWSDAFLADSAVIYLWKLVVNVVCRL